MIVACNSTPELFTQLYGGLTVLDRPEKRLASWFN
jgi:hypothetical protein